MTKTRILHCKDENCPHESQKYMSDWIRNNCPDSQSGYCVSDLDFFIWNWKTKSVMMLEIKTRGAVVRKWQKEMWQNIRKWIENGIDEDWTFFGFYCVQFENTGFDDGKCFFHNQEVSESELKEILSMEYQSHSKLIGFIEKSNQNLTFPL